MGSRRKRSRKTLRSSANSPRQWNFARSILLIVAVLLIIGAILEIHRMPSTKELQALKNTKVNRTSIMKARQESAGPNYRIRQRWLNLSHISQPMVNTVVASEDARFFSHEGLDWEEINNALNNSWSKGKSLRGASTLTQQVAKNLYLSEDRSFLRKAREAILAWRLERTLSKQEILVLYLNIAEWGDGIFGVEAASRAYFKKSASRLSLAESCTLTAMLPNPHRIRFQNPRLLFRRANLVLDRVETEHLASPLEISLAKATLRALLSSRMK